MCNCTKKITTSSPPVIANPRQRSERSVVSRQSLLRPGMPRNVSPATPATPAPPAPPETPLIADTSVWGPPLWKVLHTAAQCRGVKTRYSLWVKLFKELRTGLPCPDCSAHYNAWLNAYPIRVSLVPNGGVDIGKWLLNLHNDVNRRTGKPTWTLMQVSTSYSTNIADAKEIAETLQGKIGDRAYTTLLALLNS